VNCNKKHEVRYNFVAKKNTQETIIRNRIAEKETLEKIKKTQLRLIFLAVEAAGASVASVAAASTSTP
jgi:hypothetical protein